MQHTNEKNHNRIKKTLAIALLTIMMLGTATAPGCTGQTETGKILIVTTDFPAYDLARHVAGDLGNVIMLMKPGSSVHSYDPTPTDLINIMKSDLFVYNGGESDEWVEQILESADGKIHRVKMMDCVEAIPEEITEGMEAEGDGHDHANEDEEEEYDEHVWTSPKNAAEICEKICEKLCEKYPQYSETFRANTREYVKQINQLDEDFRQLAAGAKAKAEDGTVTLMFGDRFPFLYFVKEYGLEYYAAFPGCSEESEPNAKTVIFLAEKIKEKGIKTVFYIEFSNGNLARALAEETGANTALFHSCHNISKEDMENGETYVTLMQKNYETLKEALN